jgi:osmotically-inducible protein OsmY
MQSNLALKKELEEALRADPDIDATDIAVAAADGVVTLTGFVHSDAEKWLAERVARLVPGVLGIANDLEVRPPVLQHKTDPQLAREAARCIRNELLYSHRFIRVVVEGGWATLQGDVEWHYQKEDAELTLRENKDLTGVTNNLRVEHWVEPAEMKRRIAKDSVHDAA